MFLHVKYLSSNNVSGVFLNPSHMKQRMLTRQSQFVAIFPSPPCSFRKEAAFLFTMVRLKPSFGASAGWPEQLIAMEFTENHVETSRIAWIWAVNFLHLSSAEVPISKCFSNCLLNRRRNLTEVSHQILDNTTKTFAEFLCKGSV